MNHLTIEQRVDQLEREHHEILEFKKEIKKDFADIMHTVSQARQDNKNTTTAVNEITAQLHLIIPHLIPNKDVGSVGLFKRVTELETKERDRETREKVLKGQLALIAAIIGGVSSLLVLAVKYWLSH